jgi:HEPN domain-containing protein
MKRHTAQWVLKAEEDIEVARTLAAVANPCRNVTCFHCQESADKYLKALLQERGQVAPRTDNLHDLLSLLLPQDATLSPLRRSLLTLTRYPIDCLYPGARATTRQMQAALRAAERVRTELRARLGLPP